MHPEVMTINTVFGANEIVPKSLDWARDQHPLPQWMNGISSYSMWWILIHENWYDYHGNLEYLKEQELYMTAKQLSKHHPEGNTTKQAGALLSIANLSDAKKVNSEILTKDGVQ